MTQSCADAGTAATTAAVADAKREPADAAERARVSMETGTTMFVEAGAGTGKTRALVERVVALVSGSDPVSVDELAAITFTDKAAAELRNRIRAGLGAQLADTPDGPDADLLRNALDGLDAAAISTLHGFARRILAEHAIEAGLPPRFEALDQIASEVDFADRWDRFTDELFDDPAARWSLEMLDAAGVDLSQLNEVGVAFNANWDRIRCADEVPQAGTVDAIDVVAKGRTLYDRRVECSADDDRALARFGQLYEFVARLAAARDDAQRIAVLTDAEDSAAGVPKIGNVGSSKNWFNLSSIRTGFVELRELCSQIAAAALSDAIALICDRIARFTLEAAGQRHAAGRLEFHDLLVRARDLLRNSPTARASLHRRYGQILLDESQDTDPIQVEIATLIAGDVGDSGESGGVSGADGERVVPDSWSDVGVAPGRLFLVGDPKQSIYRFRRADIGLYLNARTRFGTEVGSLTKLQVNFRSAEPIIDWVNAVFGDLIDGDESGSGTGLQPAYTPLMCWRPAVRPGPAVVTLGQIPHSTKQQGGDHTAASIREAEAADIAALVGEMLVDGWQVEDRHAEQLRPATLADIAILVPTRTGLPQLTQGLADAQIPYRLEASEFVWRSRTVRDLMMCLRAIADPDDELAVVSALRTPIYGCGDDDLYCYHRAVRSWSCFASDHSKLAEGRAHPVARGLAHLRELYEQHTEVSPATLLDRLVRDRRLLEQAAAGSPQREVWRHVRYVIDQARAWSESQQGGLRGFLRWAETQASDRAKVTEAILPESDDDSVRVLTIHAAKGLEFPIVILAGLGGGNRARSPSVQIGFGDSAWERQIADGDNAARWSGAAAVRLHSGVETGGFEAWRERERRAEHFERIRLLYVGCTRARDHLVVSLHRPQPSDASRAAGAEHLRTSAQLIADVLPPASASIADLWDYREDPTVRLESGLSTEPAAALPRDALPDRSAWLERRDRAALASQIRSSISASHIARHRHPEDRLQPDKDAADNSLSARQRPQRRGRGGTAVGTATHGVLQVIDLSTGADLERHVAAQAYAANVPRSQHADIDRFVRSALASDEVDRALGGRIWRELYAAAPLPDSGEPGTLVEGIIDLLYEDSDTGSLVVVDFKTDALGVMPDSDGATPGRADAYRSQVATYAWCVERSTGRPVGRVALLYLRADGTPATPDVLDGEALRQAVDAVPAEALDVLASL
ncbi:UvrD-helicase domain-containing protein [Candidatus Poriferisodalis sp.]|uniref:UvrD-helicase domain-containing protein n=1 Tax=Candidatus Poriferisodalis sp. TaxID=3101277 RepID=UPI003B02BCB6